MTQSTSNTVPSFGHSRRPRTGRVPATGRTVRTIPALQPLARTLLFVAIAISGLVFSEPAPVDIVLMAVVVLVPMAGLATLAPGIGLQFTILLGCGAGGLIASGASQEIGGSASHTAVSLYLYVAFLVVAAFVANRPGRHVRLILDAWVPGAVVAATAGLAGYFQLFPGAFELFTKFGRASGTFKDPNVLGPFLVPAILYLAHRLLGGESRRALLDAGALVILVLAVLLSFSRGAWISLGVAGAIYGVLRLASEATPQARVRLVMIAFLGLLATVAGLVVVSHIGSIATLLAERSNLTQDYDVGPQGRFGGQLKAMTLALANPLGLGAKQFALHYHHEDVHNVYIVMMLNAGWLGGILYVAAVATTLWAGTLHLRYRTPTRPLFLIAFAAFIGNVVEGSIIDTDHWRHFYLLMAMIWGMIGAREIGRDNEPAAGTAGATPSGLSRVWRPSPGTSASRFDLLARPHPAARGETRRASREWTQ